MTCPGFWRLTLALMVLGVLAGSLMAHETDQFTTPPEPLADIGPEINTEIARRIAHEMAALNKSMDQDDLRPNDERLQPATLAKRLARNFGSNPFQTEFESWILNHAFEAQPAIFKVSYKDSVFNGTAATRPLLVLAVSPTVRIGDQYLGLDKIGHFVQQGYQYYEKYHHALAKPDATRNEALEAAIRHGISQENGIYGDFTIGVYSNADMAANYAGLHFYLNLTQPVSLGGKVYPPLVELHENRWRFVNGQAPADMLSRFITHHLNEAMNPPTLADDIRDTYEKNVRKRAGQWVKFHDTTQAIEDHRLTTLSRWYGEPYGYAGPQKCITISEVYFHSPDAPTQDDASHVAMRPDDDKPHQSPATDDDISAAVHSPGM